MPLLRDLPPRLARACVRDRGWRRTEVNVAGLPFIDTLGLGPPDEDQVAACRHWLRTRARVDARGLRASSQALARDAGRDLGREIENGALIVAALDLGYRVERERPRSVNARLNLVVGR